MSELEFINSDRHLLVRNLGCEVECVNSLVLRSEAIGIRSEMI